MICGKNVLSGRIWEEEEVPDLKHLKYDKRAHAKGMSDLIQNSHFETE